MSPVLGDNKNAVAYNETQ